MKTTTSPTAFPQAEIGREMKGSDAVVECLIREGVDVVFAYPGGASQELHQSLARTDKIRVILPRHEQGGSFAAEGYAGPTARWASAWRPAVPAPPISYPRSPTPSWIRSRWWRSRARSFRNSSARWRFRRPISTA